MNTTWRKLVPSVAVTVTVAIALAVATAAAPDPDTARPERPAIERDTERTREARAVLDQARAHIDLTDSQERAVVARYVAGHDDALDWLPVDVVGQVEAPDQPPLQTVAWSEWFSGGGHHNTAFGCDNHPHVYGFTVKYYNRIGQKLFQMTLGNWFTTACNYLTGVWRTKGYDITDLGGGVGWRHKAWVDEWGTYVNCYFVCTGHWSYLHGAFEACPWFLPGCISTKTPEIFAAIGSHGSWVWRYNKS